MGFTALGIAGGAALGAAGVGGLTLATGALAGAAVGSALGGSRAAGKAADVQAAGAERAADTSLAATKYASDIQLQMHEQTREDLAPWRDIGVKTLPLLEQKVLAGPGEFTADPGYKFRRQEGEKGITRAASASGGLVSGRTLKALSRYNQDYASNEYNNFLNRYYASLRPLETLSGVGQRATSETAMSGQRMASSVGATQMQGAQTAADAYYGAGQARASGYINAANAWTGAVNTGLNAYLAA